MYRVYGDHGSGNCYKVEMLLERLGLPYEWIDVDILAGETQTEAFLERNPNGKIPVLECADGACLTESNAILNYLAHGTPYLPDDPWERARVLQWQFFEQYSHEPYIAVARFIALYLGLPEDRRKQYEAKQEGGRRALGIMEGQLRESPFIAGDTLTIADLSLYAYTHVAEEGGFELADFPAVSSWLDRVAATDGHVPMRR
ncbi:glutathione S-transferase family protein [Spiribacter halobius]|uniref:Glutathione S-transferase n=1 Tax=Sediminicurvatus halobius TaxID=2182432 RepID=A0A2U2MW97_9GAMM|nr:glutathione S-transferase family protein [Spiribacter halobius]PWG61135.1 glutathione S-transferase [Spiribacter halobius]UEX77705.1 glutathione S-transferase family protein [Spiribacter halobius]